MELIQLDLIVPRIYRVFRIKNNRNGPYFTTGVRCIELGNRVKSDNERAD